MTRAWRSYGAPILAAFAIWFVHFVLCWAVAEVWPQGRLANRLAWGFTVAALLAIGVHARRVARRSAGGEFAVTGLRLARGSIVIAAVAVVFTALPSVLLRP